MGTLSIEMARLNSFVATCILWGTSRKYGAKSYTGCSRILFPGFFAFLLSSFKGLGATTVYVENSFLCQGSLYVKKFP